MSGVLPALTGRVGWPALHQGCDATSFGGWAMRPLMVGLCALGLWAAAAEPARAAWNNVFQPTLFGRSRTSTSYYVAPAVVYSAPVAAVPVVAAAVPACSTCNAPPQPSCST